MVVKIPNPDLLNSESARLRFRLETRSLIEVEHAHVVRVLDADESVPMLVVQYLSGGTLVDRILSGAQSP